MIGDIICFLKNRINGCIFGQKFIRNKTVCVFILYQVRTGKKRLEKKNKSLNIEVSIWISGVFENVKWFGGTFRVTLSSKGVEEKGKFGTETISAKISFLPGVELKKHLATMKYQQE